MLILIMRILTIIFSLISIAISTKVILRSKQLKNSNITKQRATPTTPYTAKPFSPSEYLERFEKLNLEILEEREKQSTEYEPILWIGSKGLKLNKDGTTEWIKRESSKPMEAKSISDDYMLVSENWLKEMLNLRLIVADTDSLGNGWGDNVYLVLSIENRTNLDDKELKDMLQKWYNHRLKFDGVDNKVHFKKKENLNIPEHAKNVTIPDLYVEDNGKGFCVLQPLGFEIDAKATEICFKRNGLIKMVTFTKGKISTTEMKNKWKEVADFYRNTSKKQYLLFDLYGKRFYVKYSNGINGTESPIEIVECFDDKRLFVTFRFEFVYKQNNICDSAGNNIKHCCATNPAKHVHTPTLTFKWE